MKVKVLDTLGVTPEVVEVFIVVSISVMLFFLFTFSYVVHLVIC